MTEGTGTDYDDELVTPHGGEVRRRRHERHLSPAELCRAIARASRRTTGLDVTITPSILRGIEDANERISYGTLCWVAAGLGCDPVDILGREPEADPDAALH
ncbi:MAG: hypothetical protein MJE66_00470 [Proteobacteria bacterium]|nr:hypothetical protein [Pseudomonadota bacterium]